LLIADQASGSIIRVGTNGSFTPLAALPGNPSEIAIDAAGDVFAFLPNAIVNNYSRGAVWRIAPDGTVTGILNAGILIPPPSGWGDGWSVTASFRHMTADQYGNVFVSYYAYYSGGGQCYECDFGQAGILENGGNLIGPAKWGDFGALATDSANALYFVSGPFVVKRTDTQHAVLTLRSVSTNDAGNYQVVVTAPGWSVSSSVVSLTVATSPQIYNSARNADGSIALSFVSPPGSTNLVQMATNLAPPVLWQTISTNMAGPDGDWQFTDPNTANSPERFYRSATLVGQ
jgi:hypothetical protein